MSKFKSIFKWLLIILLVLLVGLWLAIQVISEDRPIGAKGAEADLLAQKMFTALNKPAWDSLKYLTWEFMGEHKYLWDKQNNHALIEWDDHKVEINLDQISGVANSGGKRMEGEAAQKLIQEAWSLWCNDSFWMFAPFKVFDQGTSRTKVQTKDGKNALMVSYDSGGVTPGDSYLWLLDENNIPTGYKMWTFIPIQGMHMSWENWITLKGGAKVAVTHKSPILSFDMKNVKEGNSLAELGYASILFEEL